MPAATLWRTLHERQAIGREDHTQRARSADLHAVAVELVGAFGVAAVHGECHAVADLLLVLESQLGTAGVLTVARARQVSIEGWNRPAKNPKPDTKD
jgi:hypothetical protein